MADKYIYVIASINEIKNHYAVKWLPENSELANSDIQKLLEKYHKIQFSIDDTKIIYIGRREFEYPFVRSPEKVEFFLSSYKSKLNNDIYKIDLERLIGIVGYDSICLFFDLSVFPILEKSIKEESLRLKRWETSTEFTNDDNLDDIYNQFEKLEANWFDFYKEAEKIANDLEDKYPNPNKKDYIRSGVGSLVLGKFNKDKYETAYNNRVNSFRDLCYRLTKTALKGKRKFNADCPFKCGLKVEVGISISEGRYKLEEFHPQYIYSKIDHLYGECSRCGRFHINFFPDSDNPRYTCIISGNYDADQIYWFFEDIYSSVSYKN